jgi:hypothetical protein
MTRNMVGANTAIFQRLDDFVSSLGYRVPNSGSPRWIGTNPTERGFLRESKVLNSVRIGKNRCVLHLEYGGFSFFSTVGFSDKIEAAHLEEIDITSSQLTVVLFESSIEPNCGPLRIIEHIGGQDKASDKNYSGHSSDLISPLFPPIRIFKFPEGVIDDFWQAHFMLCLEEAVSTGSWLDQDLFRSLKTMSELDSAKIPYPVLCRSIFDHDKTSLFLALYRCLEALYSYSSTASLVASLGIRKDWKVVSKQLEVSLSWYPREDAALQGLFQHAGMKELTDISEALDIATDPPANFSARSARAVYELRNKAVHFRPFHQDVDFDLIDWNKLCAAMSCIVLDVYNEIG